MKYTLKTILKGFGLPIAIGIMFTLLTINLPAQPPPPPNGGNDPGSGNNNVGGNAPIAGGVGILLTLSAAYGIKKVYHINKDENE